MRSQAGCGYRRPEPGDPADEWDNGSWTVDCVCGVNFDDGEEMVDCDECGVWVHTRCSRYVKSEKSFVCDKCKTRKKSNKRGFDENGGNQDGEAETEVAKFLVEMPNKSLTRSGENVGFRRRVSTQVPREERVHVQGVPGGEDGFFGGSGLSGVFGAGLWKASGYVPKKFSFRYEEFDCWNGGNESVGYGAGNDQGVCLLNDKAGVDGDTVCYDAGKRTQGEESKKKNGEEGEGEDLNVRNTLQNGMNKERTLMNSTIIYRGKRKKEDSQTSNDASGKKKVRAVHVERDDSNKTSPPNSRSVFTPSIDAKHSGFHEGKGFKVDQNVISCGKHEKIKGNVPPQPSSKGFPKKGVGVDESKSTLVISGQTSSETPCVVSTHRLSLKARQKDERDGLTATIQNSSKISDGVQLLLDCNDSRSLSAKNEDIVDLDNLNDNGGCVNRSDQVQTEHLVEKMKTIAPQVKDSQNDYGSNDNMSQQVELNDSVGVSHVQSSPCDENLDGVGHDPFTQKLDDLGKHTVAADCQIDNAGVPSKHIVLQANGQLFGLDNARLVMESSLGLEEVRHTREPSKSCEDTLVFGLMQRTETDNHSNCQQSSKVNHTLQVHNSAAPNTPATISDEELALLLHHELNSSSRLPRMPRMRHAGSLPQLASPTGTNMFMKQSSFSSAGKDHGSVLNRNGKSIAKEGTENSQELQDESRNVKRSPLLPVRRTNDSSRTADSGSKREAGYGSAPGIQFAKKSNPHATSKRNVSSRCKPAQNASDDDTGSDIRVTRRTLPGLLSEIITKRMTYKELCDAVLPHWPYLRKNNGERYAYSSHSQAILDCLRSRSEWARLVDRGPKSNAGRKRRRFDAEAPSFESEDNNSNKQSTTGADFKRVVESCQDQFPKGKRNMRKRHRRLALQGRGIKNMVIRRRRKQMEADDVSYNVDSSLSSSSSEEESMSSEDETIQWDDGTSSAGGPSEVSASD